MLCERYRVHLRYVTVGGKRVLRCPYSHKKHYEEDGHRPGDVAASPAYSRKGVLCGEKSELNVNV